VRHRRSTRLRAYDYRTPGAYFVTVCTRERHCVLGEIADGQVVLSLTGEVVRDVWVVLPQRLPTVALDAFVVMPNHVHGVLWLNAPDARGPEPEPTAPTLGQVIRTFKASSARLARVPCPEFAWQRNYWERVVRNENELERVREYIAANPVLWAEDEENPATHPGHLL
jgi:REP element-mobilizing transposase RayT